MITRFSRYTDDLLPVHNVYFDPTSHLSSDMVMGGACVPSCTAVMSLCVCSGQVESPLLLSYSLEMGLEIVEPCPLLIRHWATTASPMSSCGAIASSSKVCTRGSSQLTSMTYIQGTCRPLCSSVSQREMKQTKRRLNNPNEVTKIDKVREIAECLYSSCLI